MDLLVRVPDYAGNYHMTVGGEAVGSRTENGYWKLHVEKDCRIEVAFETPAHYVYANPQVRADAGKAAIMRGPLVYCLEECDNVPIFRGFSRIPTYRLERSAQSCLAAVWSSKEKENAAWNPPGRAAFTDCANRSWRMWNLPPFRIRTGTTAARAK